jgi:hypothetical protein
MILLLFVPGEALLDAVLQVIEYNREDFVDFFPAKFGKLPLDCLAKSEPCLDGEVPFVAWLCPHLHMQYLPVPINVRYCKVYALSVLAIKEECVNSVEDGNTNQCGA